MKPDPTEYFFDDVPDEEAAGCCFYEYARESQRIWEAVFDISNAFADLDALHPEGFLVPEIRADSPEEVNADRGIAVAHFYVEGTPASRIIRFPVPKKGDINKFADAIIELARIPGFPNASWQSLPNSFGREQLLSTLSSDWPEPPPTLITREIRSDTTFADFLEWVSGQYPEIPPINRYDQAYLLIDPTESNERLTEGFLAFVKVLREKRGIPPVNKGRRGKIPHARLRERGALRLRNPEWGLTQPAASKLLRGAYQDSGTYARACRSAIDHFRRFFALEDSEWPIHRFESFP